MASPPASTTTVLSLASELQIRVCDFLDQQDLSNVRLTCKELNAAALENWHPGTPKFSQYGLLHPVSFSQLQHTLGRNHLAQELKWVTLSATLPSLVEKGPLDHPGHKALTALFRGLRNLEELRVRWYIADDAGRGRSSEIDNMKRRICGLFEHEMLYAALCSGLPIMDIECCDGKMLRPEILEVLSGSRYAMRDVGRKVESLSYDGVPWVEASRKNSLDESTLSLPSATTSQLRLLRLRDFRNGCGAKKTQGVFWTSTQFLLAHEISPIETLDLWDFDCTAAGLTAVFQKCMNTLRVLKVHNVYLHEPGTGLQALIQLKACRNLASVECNNCFYESRDPDPSCRFILEDPSRAGGMAHWGEKIVCEWKTVENVEKILEFNIDIHAARAPS